MNGEDLVDPLTLYPITCVPRVFAVFKNMKNEYDVKGIIEVRERRVRSSALLVPNFTCLGKTVSSRSP